jgi:Spy/CpxP family protein refolding chaperone
MLIRVAGSILALAMIAAMLAVPAARADQGGQPFAHRPESSRLQEHLGLSAEQTQAIREIRERNRQSGAQIAQALRQARQELRQLALAGAESGVVEAKAAQVEQLMGEALRLQVKTLQEIAPLLSDEQRQKMEQLGPNGHRGRRGYRS